MDRDKYTRRLEKRNQQLRDELSAALDVCEAVGGLYKPLPQGGKTLSDLEDVGRAYRAWQKGTGKVNEW